MQQFTYETEMERSRAGHINRHLTIAQTQPKPPKRSKNPLTERGQDTVLIWCFLIAIGTYLAGSVWQGLPAVLARHGLI